MIHTKNSRLSGFSLLELMIVISVVALLISISGYGWQVMVRRGNEVAAVSHITKIKTAQAYYASKRKGRFASRFDELTDAGLLDKAFKGEAPLIDGYTFTLETDKNPPKYFSLHADPETSSGIRATGTTHYFLDSANHSILYTDEDRPANSEDASL